MFPRERKMEILNALPNEWLPEVWQLWLASVLDGKGKLQAEKPDPYLSRGLRGTLNNLSS